MVVDLGIDGLDDAVFEGSGGSASVYRATNQSGETVAVKVFSGVWDDTRQRRFERELEAMEKLADMDSVVSLSGYGQTSNGSTYLTMPYYPNGSLHDLVKKQDGLSWQTATSLVSTIAATIADSHDRGIFHRDLKPANILLNNNHETIVSDFGITQIVDGRSQSTMAAYTPGFAPPEALTKGVKGTNGTSHDVYSLGATLWSAISGKQPFVDTGEHGTDPLVLFGRLTNEPLESIPNVPNWVNDVVAQATAKRPEDRYETVGDFVADLKTEGIKAKNASFKTGTVSQATPTLDSEKSPLTVARKVQPKKVDPVDQPKRTDRTRMAMAAIATVAVVGVATAAAIYALSSETGDENLTASSETTPAVTVDDETKPAAPDVNTLDTSPSDSQTDTLQIEADNSQTDTSQQAVPQTPQVNSPQVAPVEPAPEPATTTTVAKAAPPIVGALTNGPYPTGHRRIDAPNGDRCAASHWRITGPDGSTRVEIGGPAKGECMGQNHTLLTNRLYDAPLEPGTYSVTLAVTAADGQVSRTAATTFTVT